jgi:hypothetical protein
MGLGDLIHRGRNFSGAEAIIRYVHAPYRRRSEREN